MSREIIDCHHHLWNPALIQVPWLASKQASFGDPSRIAGLYVTRNYLADAAPLKVKASVHVEPAGRPDDAILEAFWLTGLADGSGLPTALVAYADIEAPDLGQRLDTLQRSPRLRGVRMRLNYDEPSGKKIARSADVMVAPAFQAGLRELGRRGLVFNLSIFAPQLHQAARLAEAVPDCTLVLEHIGWPLATDARAHDEWQAGLHALAARPNTAVKISGLWSVDRNWDEATIAPWVRGAFDAFGPTRCMYGSNLPIEKLMCPMPDQVARIERILADKGADALAAIFEGNATRVYRLQQ